MDIPETQLMLEQVRSYDHREITDRLVADWQHALMRLTIEATFDAIHDHFERCNSAHIVTLTAGEVLYHARLNRGRREAEERAHRAAQRNEGTFDELADHRTTTDQDRARAAARLARQQLDHALELRALLGSEQQ